jgi:hypothetical protein
LLTLFLCITTGNPPKTSLTEKAAKTLIKKVRDEGLNPEPAIAWIKTSAPHEKQEGLLDDWRNFIDEATNYLMDDWDSSYSGALRFLADNCHLEKTAKK